MKSKKSIKGIIIMTALAIATMFFLNISLAKSTATIKVETANLREKANVNSKILELLPINQKVDIIEKEGEWYKVKANGIVGYLREDILNITSEKKKEEPKQQEKPKEEPKQQEKPKEEPKEEPKQEEKPKEEKTNKRKVNKNTKLKLVPSINATEIIELKENEIVTILEEINGWVCVQSDMKKGWIREERLKSVEEAKPEPKPEVIPTPEATPAPTPEPKEEKLIKTLYISSELVNMRKDASANSEIIARLNLNTPVDIYGELDVWYKVKVNGKDGYISKSLLSNKKQESSRSLAETRNKNEEEKSKEVKPSAKGGNIVETAMSNMGKRYVYGATGPNSFDCSGFTKYVFEQHGISLSRTAQGQYNNGSSINKEQLQPGDLVMFGKSEKGINHVGIYIGGGKMVHAANPKRGVVTDTINSGYYHDNYVGARRAQ